MTRKTRYFVLAAGAVLVVGLGGGLVAYLAYNRVAGLPAGMPPEMRYVPANAAVVAFADVRAVMSSELRRSLMPSVDPESRKGRQMMNDFAGVDLEKQVNRVVAYVEQYKAPDPQAQAEPDIPRALVLVHGTFDSARIESFIRERAGTAMDDYKGRKILMHREHGQDIAVGLVGSDLIAMGPADLVRGIIDLSQGSGLAKNITANAEMMDLDSRQQRQHRMGRRTVRRDSPPYAPSKRCGAAGASDQAGIGQGQYQRRHQSDDPCRGRRQSCGGSTARRRARFPLARTAAGRRKAGDRQHAQVDRADGQRRVRPFVHCAIARSPSSSRAWAAPPRERWIARAREARTSEVS